MTVVCDNTVMQNTDESLQVLTLSAQMSDEITAVVEMLEAQLDEHEIPRPQAEGGIPAVVRGMLLHPERGMILVAKQNEKTIGVAYLACTWTLEKGGPAIWLEELYVRKELRGRGIGERLLAESMQRAAARGIVSMDLEVESSHERAANLYRRHGFEELPRRRYTRWLDGR